MAERILEGIAESTARRIEEAVLIVENMPTLRPQRRGRWPVLSGRRGDDGTLIIGFQIESIENDVVTARITFRPCGISEVPEEYDGTVELLDDLYECLLNEDDAALINRRGHAAYMEDAEYHLCGWQVLGLCCP